jgi:glycosyltransferase involved in cell wall biosynthesis
VDCTTIRLFALENEPFFIHRNNEHLKMNILFVGSGTDGGTIIKAQGESLKKSGIQVDYFFMNKGGFRGYFKSISRLRAKLQTKDYDLIHSHYLLSAIISSLSSKKPQVVSLMGSDVLDSTFLRWISKYLYFLRWKATIVKSDEMKALLKLKKIHVIPNGVDLDNFHPLNKTEAREKIGWDQSTYVLFGSNPDRKEKNYELAEKACKLINIPGIKLIPIKNIPHEEIILYLNACDTLLLTSFYEGSPNIVKEAMACNCPVVTTDVGDVRKILGSTEGCYITGYEPLDVAGKIALAINHRAVNHFTQGRKQLIQNRMDSNSVALSLKTIYEKLIASE